MELQGGIDCDVIGYTSKATKDGELVSVVTLTTSLSENQARALGGTILSEALFAPFVGQSGEALLTSAKLARVVQVSGPHLLRVGDQELNLQARPQMVSVELSERERRVTLRMQLSIPGDERPARRLFDDAVGTAVHVMFSGLVQPELTMSMPAELDEDDSLHAQQPF